MSSSACCRKCRSWGSWLMFRYLVTAMSSAVYCKNLVTVMSFDSAKYLVMAISSSIVSSCF